MLNPSIMTAYRARRAELCVKAFDAGISFHELQAWWPELAALTMDERPLVRAAVKRVIEKARVAP